MAAYLRQVIELIPSIRKSQLAQILCLENVHADASSVGRCKDFELIKVVLIEHLAKISIMKGEEVMLVEDTLSWIWSNVSFLKDPIVPEAKKEAHKLKKKALYFVLQNDILY